MQDLKFDNLYTALSFLFDVLRILVKTNVRTLIDLGLRWEHLMPQTDDARVVCMGLDSAPTCKVFALGAARRRRVRFHRRSARTIRGRAETFAPAGCLPIKSPELRLLFKARVAAARCCLNGRGNFVLQTYI
jgi:hypothetical protein